MADAYRMQGKYELALAHLQSARKSLDVNTSDFQETYKNLEQVPWISSRSLTVRYGRSEFSTGEYCRAYPFVTGTGNS